MQRGFFIITQRARGFAFKRLFLPFRLLFVKREKSALNGFQRLMPRFLRRFNTRSVSLIRDKRRTRYSARLFIFAYSTRTHLCVQMKSSPSRACLSLRFLSTAATITPDIEATINTRHTAHTAITRASTPFPPPSVVSPRALN